MENMTKLIKSLNLTLTPTLITNPSPPSSILLLPLPFSPSPPPYSNKTIKPNKHSFSLLQQNEIKKAEGKERKKLFLIVNFLTYLELIKSLSS